MNRVGLVSVTLLVCIFTCVAGVPRTCHAEERSNAVSGLVGGAVAPDLVAFAVFGQYERLLTSNLGVYGRLGNLSYEYDDGWYVEDGSGVGVQGGVRLHMGGRGLRGFFLGGGIGLWSTDWDWEEGDYYRDYGSGSSTAVDTHFHVGGHFAMGGSGVFLEPTAQVGYFATSGSELGFYSVIGLAVGFAF